MQGVYGLYFKQGGGAGLIPRRRSDGMEKNEKKRIADAIREAIENVLVMLAVFTAIE